MVDGRFSSLFILSLSRFSFRQFWTPCTSISHGFTSWERTIRTNILIAILRLSHFPRPLSLELRLTKMKRFVLNFTVNDYFLGVCRISNPHFCPQVVLCPWNLIWLKRSFKYLCYHSRELFSFVIDLILIHQKDLSTSGLFSLKQKQKHTKICKN